MSVFMFFVILCNFPCVYICHSDNDFLLTFILTDLPGQIKVIMMYS